MKRTFVLTCLSAAFLFNVGCQSTPTPPPASPAAPKAPASAAPASPAAAAPASAAPAGTSSGAPAAAGAAEKLATKNDPSWGMAVDVPDAWKQNNEKGTLTVEKQDGSAVIVVTAIPTDKAKEYTDNIGKGLEKSMSDIKEDKSAEKMETVNGLKQMVARGTGLFNSTHKTIEWSLWLIDGGQGKSLTVLGMGDIKGNEATYEGVRKSIKSAGGSGDDAAKKGGDDVKKGADDLKKGDDSKKSD